MSGDQHKEKLFKSSVLLHAEKLFRQKKATRRQMPYGRRGRGGVKCRGPGRVPLKRWCQTENVSSSSCHLTRHNDEYALFWFRRWCAALYQPPPSRVSCPRCVILAPISAPFSCWFVFLFFFPWLLPSDSVRLDESSHPDMWQPIGKTNVNLWLWPPVTSQSRVPLDSPSYFDTFYFSLDSNGFLQEFSRGFRRRGHFN